MKLYFAPGACSLAPHIVLHEAGIPHEVEKVDLRKHQTKSGEDFYAINPKGYVPALRLDDGQLLTEVTVVLQYLADRKPDAALAPANGTIERYRLQEWLGYLNSEIHKTFGIFFSDSDDTEKGKAGKRLEKKFGWLEQQLEGKTFLTGDRFAVADAYLFTLLGWSGYAGLDLGKWPKLKAYHARIAERPSVQAALDMEKAA